MSALIKYDAACRAVAEAASIDEAKEFRDQSEAMRAYARQAKNKDMEAKAAEIRFRAERRIGELMAAQKASFGSAQGRRSDLGFSGTQVENAPITLSEAGIDKNLADRARKFAAIPEQDFNGIVDDWRGRIERENARVSINLLEAGAKAETEGNRREPEKPQSCMVADPYGYANLTDAALLETANGLRAGYDEKSCLLKKANERINRLENDIRDFEASSDLGPVVSRLKAQIVTLKGAHKDAMANAAKETRRANFIAKERDSLRKQLGLQEIEI